MLLGLILTLGGLAIVLTNLRLFLMPFMRESKHKRTLAHIRELEVANGIAPEDYWDRYYIARPILTASFAQSVAEIQERHRAQPVRIVALEAQVNRTLVERNTGHGIVYDDLPAGELPPK